MTVTTIEVVKVEKVPAGKTERVVVHYVGKEDAIWKIGNLIDNFDAAARLFLKELSSKVPCKVDIEKEKQGDFWNLVKIGESGSMRQPDKPAYKSNASSSYKKPYSPAPRVGSLTDVEKGEGQQRGNVLTNATNLVIA